jgi:hypothetical protein
MYQSGLPQIKTSLVCVDDILSLLRARHVACASPLSVCIIHSFLIDHSIGKKQPLDLLCMPVLWFVLVCVGDAHAKF